jgi:hypothetical protein
MAILDKHLSFVKDQILFHEKMANKFASNEFRKNLHLSTAEKFKSLEKDLFNADTALLIKEIHEPRKVSVHKLNLTPECIEGLPEDLIKELSISEGDKTEFLILNVIEENGGVASLDKILIGVYKKTQEIMKRTALTARLYRMSQKQTVYNVVGKKGVYSLRELTPEEILQLN